MSPDYLFSSPEPKAHWWAFRIGRPQSSVCLSSILYKHLLLRNRLASRSQISYGASRGWWNESLFKRSRSHDQDGLHAKMASMPIYGKKLKKSFSVEWKGQWPWNLVCSFGYSSTTKFIQMMTLGWCWPNLRQGQICSRMLLYGIKVKQWIFQKLL